MSGSVDNRPVIDGIPHPATLKDLQELCASPQSMHINAADAHLYAGEVVLKLGRTPIGVSWLRRSPKARPGKRRDPMTVTFIVVGGRDEALGLDDMVREFNRVREQRLRDQEWEAAGGDGPSC